MKAGKVACEPGVDCLLVQRSLQSRIQHCSDGFGGLSHRIYPEREVTHLMPQNFHLMGQRILCFVEHTVIESREERVHYRVPGRVASARGPKHSCFHSCHVLPRLDAVLCNGLLVVKTACLFFSKRQVVVDDLALFESKISVRG